MAVAVKVAPRQITELGPILTISLLRQPSPARYSMTASAGDQAFLTPTVRLPEQTE